MKSRKRIDISDYVYRVQRFFNSDFIMFGTEQYLLCPTQNRRDVLSEGSSILFY